MIGTPLYMAPEQIVGGRLEPATDLYALGVLRYLLLAGVEPFDPALPASTLRQRLDQIPPPPPGVPTRVARVILWALAAGPAARPPSARAFAFELARAAADVYGPGWIARSGIVLRRR